MLQTNVNAGHTLCYRTHALSDYLVILLQWTNCLQIKQMYTYTIQYRYILQSVA